MATTAKHRATDSAAIQIEAVPQPVENATFQPISRANRRAWNNWLWLLCLCVLSMAGAAAKAQTLQTVAPLTFTKTVNSTSNPLPQVITVASTDASTVIGVSIGVINGTGGNWLTTNPSGGTYYTPAAFTVSANPNVSLSSGTYTAQIVLTTNTTTTKVPVTLIIEPTSATYFDALPGALTYSLQTGATAPPSQLIPIRNAGAGTLSFSASSTTADGGKWITLSATSGAAPFQLNASINPGNLPSQGKVAGTFTGQVLLKTGSDSVTIPVSVSVGDNVLSQINPLSFTKTVNSLSQALSQVITVSDTDSSQPPIGLDITVLNGTGGSWLSTNINGGTYYTSQPITVSVNPAVTLAAGTYTAEIVIGSNAQAVVIPVTLTVAAATSTYFDELPGELTFSMQTAAATAPPPQLVQIRNGGAGTLSFTASASTADGGNWLVLSATSGTAPFQLNVSINAANLPNEGKVAGTFSGQVLLKTGNDIVTIPVTATVADAVLIQINPLSFTKTLNSTSQPLSQVITVANTDPSNAAIGFAVTVVNGTGGNWLSTSINGGTYYAPQVITVSVNPNVSLAAGTYTAEVVIASSAQAVVVPVTLTVAASTTTYFDALGGNLTFSMQTGAPTGPPAQVVQIRNEGVGTLNFTASSSTADGGNWITLSAASGTAPYLLNVGITPANLPGLGKVDGTFLGQVLLKTGNDTVTLPVTVTVGDAVLLQINPLSFTKTVNSASQPPPQIVTVANTDPGNANVGFAVTVINGTGGNWLSSNINGGTYYSPLTITLSANPDVSLAAGTYTAEVVIAGAGQPVVVPVSLTVASSTAPYFDSLPGGLTFSSQTTGAAIPSQPISVRNAGPGTLNWAATVTTSDGGKWLNISSASGTSPSSRTVSITPANLPGKGLVPGMFIGQIMFQTVGDIVTVPVTVTIGDSVLTPIAPLSFSKKYQAANPPAQTITPASTDQAIGFTVTTTTSNGGNWLTTSITGGTYYTPQAITVTVNPNVNLAPGVYSGEIILSNTEPQVIPVTLTIDSSPAAVAPVFNPPAGNYNTAQSVTISSSTIDSSIYYTIDGSTPTTSSTVYKGPILVSTTETLKAIAVAPAFPTSTVSIAHYDFGPIPATPVATSTVTISEATAGVTVYYTTNGSTPTSASTKYTGPITVSSTEVLKFIAIGPDGTSSSAVRTDSTTIQ